MRLVYLITVLIIGRLQAEDTTASSSRESSASRESYSSTSVSDVSTVLTSMGTPPNTQTTIKDHTTSSISSIMSTDNLTSTILTTLSSSSNTGSITPSQSSTMLSNYDTSVPEIKGNDPVIFPSSQVSSIISQSSSIILQQIKVTDSSTEASSNNSTLTFSQERLFPTVTPDNSSRAETSSNTSPSTFSQERVYPTIRPDNSSRAETSSNTSPSTFSQERLYPTIRPDNSSRAETSSNISPSTFSQERLFPTIRPDNSSVAGPSTTNPTTSSSNIPTSSKLSTALNTPLTPIIYTPSTTANPTPPLTSTEILVVIKFEIKIWISDFSNTTSPAFIKESNNIENEIKVALRTLGIVEVKVFDLRQGSVIANASLKFNQTTSYDAASSAIKANIAGTSIIDPTTTKLPDWAVIVIAVFCTLLVIGLAFAITAIVCRRARHRGYGRHGTNAIELEESWRYNARNSAYKEDNCI